MAFAYVTARIEKGEELLGNVRAEGQPETTITDNFTPEGPSATAGAGKVTTRTLGGGGVTTSIAGVTLSGGASGTNSGASAAASGNGAAEKIVGVSGAVMAVVVGLAVAL